MTGTPKIQTSTNETAEIVGLEGVGDVQKAKASLKAQIGGALLALGLSTGVVQAQEQTKQEVQVAQAAPLPSSQVALANDANSDIITGSITSQQTELEKSGYGTYEAIINEFLKTNDPEILTFVRRECEKYLTTIPETERKKVARKVMANMKDFFGYASTPDMPSQSTIDFFVQNVPQMVIEFARYPDKYPNLASKGKLLIATIKNNEATAKNDEATKLLKKLQDINGKKS